MKNTPAFGLAAVLACLGTPPAYALHKCTTKEGKVIYTEFECEKDAKTSGVPIHDSAGVDTRKKGGSAATSSSSRAGRHYNHPGIVSEGALRGSGINPAALPKVPPGGYTDAEYKKAIEDFRKENVEKAEESRKR